jgi:hypothetical protein
MDTINQSESINQKINLSQLKLQQQKEKKKKEIKEHIYELIRKLL